MSNQQSKAEGLDEKEMQLLAILSRNPTGSGIYTLEGLARDIGIDPDSVYRKLLALEERGYLRIVSISEPLSNPSEWVDRLLDCLHRILQCAQKIEGLMDRKSATKESVYQRIFKDLLKKFNEEVERMRALAKDLRSELERMDQQVEEYEEKIEELRIREEIGDISKEQATKLLESYQSDIEEILKRKGDLLGEFSGKRPEATDENLRKKLEDLSTQIQLLWVRHQVGEISEEEHEKRKQQLEEERKSLLQKFEQRDGMKKMAKEVVEIMRKLNSKDSQMNEASQEVINQLKSIFELAGACEELLGEK